MANLTVWIAVQHGDAVCYNVIGRTRKAAQEQLDALPDGNSFDAPRKVVIQYKDAFDLFDWVTSEGGGRHISL